MSSSSSEVFCLVSPDVCELFPSDPLTVFVKTLSSLQNAESKISIRTHNTITNIAKIHLPGKHVDTLCITVALREMSYLPFHFLSWNLVKIF